MSVEFSTKGAKEIINDYQNAEKRVEQALHQIQSQKAKISTASEMLSYSPELRQYISDYLDGKINRAEPEEFVNLKHELDRYISVEQFEPVLERVIESYHQAIEPQILNLKPRTSAMQWLFSGKQKKDKAEGAFDYLVSLQSDTADQYQEYADRVERLLGKKQEYIGSSAQTYRKELRRLCPDALYRQNEIPEVQTIFLMKHRAEETLKSIHDDMDAYAGKVKKAADILMAAEAYKFLQTISVDELNRDKNGIRIKALKDYGYNTIASVNNASVYTIASINGISENMAYQIKSKTSEIAANAAAGVKIKLNYDNQDKASTALLTVLNQYVNEKQRSREVLEIEHRNSNQIKRYSEISDPKNFTLEWMLRSSEEKASISDALNKLSAILGNELMPAIVKFSNTPIDISLDSHQIWESFRRNPIPFFTALEEIEPGLLGNNDASYGLPEDLAKEIQDEAFFPDGLLCDLRPYQVLGVKYILHQEKVLLGDEMGLGKTIQAIASMVSLRNTGEKRFMVVCPASVVANWCREINEKSKLRAVKVHGSTRSSAIRDWAKYGGVAVTTYETIVSLNMKETFKFGMLVVDEAHYVKNPEAMRSQAVKELISHTDRVLFMTGTALENKVEEMTALIDLLQPEIAGKVRGVSYLSSAPKFREIVAPVYYRRKRADVLHELPELTEEDEWCTLSPREEEDYEYNILNHKYADARRVSWSMDDPRDSTKAKRMLELISQAKSEDRTVIIFSFFLNTIKEVMTLLGKHAYGPITGSVSVNRRQEIIDEFKSAPAGSALVAQIQSGGTGLNIQSASVVIICEPQLKPSIENQAVSRAYRMGQGRNVLVYRLLAENTIDEKIKDMLDEKQKIFNAFADKSVAADRSAKLNNEKNAEIDNETLSKIIQEEIDRINQKNEETAA